VKAIQLHFTTAAARYRMTDCEVVKVLGDNEELEVQTDSYKNYQKWMQLLEKIFEKKKKKTHLERTLFIEIER
jgi:hypothetical protein